MRAIRTLGIVTLVLAVGAVIAGVWWFDLGSRRRALTDDRTAIVVATSSARTMHAQLSRAVFFGVVEASGVVEHADAESAGEAALEEAESFAGLALPGVELGDRQRGAVVWASTVLDRLNSGDADGAQEALADDAGELDGFLVAAAADLADLDSGLSKVDSIYPVAMVATLVGSVLVALSTLALVIAALRKPMTEAPTHIVIELPRDPNQGPNGRRAANIDDLGILIADVLRPFETRGWSMDIDCPGVAVDCEPDDVRDILTSLLGRAESGDAERIGVIVKAARARVRVVVADDGTSIFGSGGFASGSEPVWLKSAVRTGSETTSAELRWSRSHGLNLAVLDMPRRTRVPVVVG